MLDLNPNHLRTIHDAEEFMATLPKTFEFWDDTSPQLREAYQIFLRALRKEVRFLKQNVLRYDLRQLFEGESISPELIDTIRFHLQNASIYFVWRCCDGTIRSDNNRPAHFETIWIISRNPDQCIKRQGRQKVAYRLQHARHPQDSSLNS